MVIRFRPGRLGGKPDALTRRWDVYLKEGISDYATVNPHNLKPIFTNEQLTVSVRATYLIHPVMRSAIVMDIEKLHQDILSALPEDPVTKAHLDNPSDPDAPRWSQDSQGFIRLDN